MARPGDDDDGGDDYHQEGQERLKGERHDRYPPGRVREEEAIALCAAWGRSPEAVPLRRSRDRHSIPA
jgi:hypothetical protein